jgi:hypothetical protein
VSRSESAHERCNRLQREWRAKKSTKLAEPSETLQERSNRLCRKQRIVQQAIAHAQPSIGNDTLQLFRDEDALTPGRWDYGEMDTICGFYNVKMWIKERLAKSSNKNPQFSVLQKWQSFVAESSYNTARVGSSLNQQSEQCCQISKSDSHVQFVVGIHFPWCQS